MAEPQKKPKGTGMVPMPEQPLFDLDAVINAPTLTDATAVHAGALNALSNQRATLDIDSLVQKADLLTTTSRQAQEIFKNNQTQTRVLTTAQQRRGQIEKIPPLVGRILGLFDKDYDWGYWNETVRGAKLSLAANEQQLSQIQVMSQLQESIINNQIDMVGSQYAQISGNFDRALSVRQVMAQEEQRTFQNRLAMSAEHRAAAGFEMDKITFNQQQEDRTVTTLDDTTLLAAAKGSIEGVKPALAIKEQQKRARDALALQEAAQGVKINDLNMADSGRRRFIASQSPEVLTGMAEDAKASGGQIQLNVDGVAVPFTATELARGAADAAGADLASRKAMAERMVQISSIQPNVNAVMETALRISTATGVPGIHPKAQRIMNDTLTKIQPLLDRGDDASLLLAADMTAKAVTDMDKVADDTIKSFPTKQQGFVTDQFDGRPSSPQNVNDFLGDMIFNPEALNAGLDQKISVLWKTVADEAKKIQSTSLSVQKDDEGNIILPSEVSNRGQVIQTALGNVMNDGPNGPGIVSRFKGMRTYDAIQTAMSDLNKQVPWLRGITSLQQFADPANPGNVDTGRLLAYLRDKYIADLQAGLIPIGGSMDQVAVQPYDKQFIRYMQRPEFQRKIAENWSNYTLQGRAFFQSFSGGDPLIDYQGDIDQIEQMFESTYQAEKAAVNNMTSQDLATFRRQYAAEINMKQMDIMKNDPNMSQSAARNQAEVDLYKQAQGLKTQMLNSGGY